MIDTYLVSVNLLKTDGFHEFIRSKNFNDKASAIEYALQQYKNYANIPQFDIEIYETKWNEQKAYRTKVDEQFYLLFKQGDRYLYE